MASLYKRSGSPFWWLEFRDESGRRCQRSTHLRHNLPHEAKQAARLLERHIAIENSNRPPDCAEGFMHWVPRFLDQRYADSPLTHPRVLIEWRTVSSFMRSRGISVPRQVSRQMCRDFLAYRTSNGRTRATALNEIKTLSLIMGEAVA